MIKWIIAGLLALSSVSANALDPACSLSTNLKVNYCPQNSIDWYQSYTDMVNWIDFLSTGTPKAFGINQPSPLANGTLVVKSTSTTALTPVINLQDSSGNKLFEVDQNGNVGIGTTSPVAILDVNGSVAIRGATTVANSSFTVNNASMTITGQSNIGWERISNACGAGVTTCTATCSSNKVIVGGGCSTSAVGLTGDSGNTVSWTCTSAIGTITAIAYCARLGP